MLIRNFEGRKYRRTYVGGTKEKELETFLEVQGTKEDNSECDWLEYRRIFTSYFDDRLHVILSWRMLMIELSYVALILGVLAVKIPILLFTLIGLSVVFRLISFNFKQRQLRQARNYDIGLDITLTEINKQTGFNISKN